MNIFQDILGNGKNEANKGDRAANECQKANQGDQTDQADQIEILERHIDPRPDLKGDNLAWGDILQNSLVWDGLKDAEKLWGVLHGLRCGGARIQSVNGGLGYKLLPGEWKAEAWEGVKADYLEGVKGDLIELFKFTKEFGRLPRLVELWPEGAAKEVSVANKAVKQDKLF